MEAKEKKAEVKGQKTGHLKRNVLLMVLAALILGGILFYNAYLSGGIINAYTQLSNNPSNLQPILFQKINAAPQFKLSYLGLAYGNVNTTSLKNQHISVPFTLDFSRYGNNTRFGVSVNNANSIGIANFSAVGVSINNGTKLYACYNVNGAGYGCSDTRGSILQIAGNLSGLFGLSGISKFNVTGVLPSLYDGMPCWSVSGNGTVYGNGVLFRGNSANINFTTCLSPQYYIPLNANITILPSGTGPIIILLQEKDLEQATTQAQVTSLPGPVSNST